MDVTADLLPNPLYHPLPPSISNLLEYADEVEAEAKYLTPEWSQHEISNHLTGFVRVGLLADIICRYRHYKTVTKTWASYCQNIIGLSQWYVRRTINAAKCVLALARAGFSILPKNEAQARPLTKFEGDELLEKWAMVCKAIPPHRMTAAAIQELLDEDSNKPVKISLQISPALYRRLLDVANDEGVSMEVLLDRLLAGEIEPDHNSEEVREQESEEIREQPKKCANWRPEQTWLDDLEKLITEHSSGDYHADRPRESLGGVP